MNRRCKAMIRKPYINLPTDYEINELILRGNENCKGNE